MQLWNDKPMKANLCCEVPIDVLQDVDKQAISLATTETALLKDAS